jgi:DNA-binding response OmpR family regulator
MSTGVDPKRWINLERVSVLLLEQGDHSRKIASQILRGFGIRDIQWPRSLDEARTMTRQVQFDLVVADPGALQGAGIEFLNWLRRAESNANRFVPIILVSGHSTTTAVMLSRDTGANFFVAKPFTPKILLERIMFVSRDKRPYVEAGAYVGPDRRWKGEGPPDGTPGRRSSDLRAEIEEIDGNSANVNPALSR